LALPLATALCVGMLGGADAPLADAAKAPKAGRYAGKVGTFAQIIFNVRRGSVVQFNAGVKTNCQRSSDGAITESQNVATAPAEHQPKAKLRVRGRKRIFSGKGQDESGVAWAVKGRFVLPRKAKGSFEASKFESIFNPLLPFGIDGQLCAGSGSWTATLKR
jgi:hypothetical protein